MKKNVRKKLLSLIVCAALMLSMAVPAFADWVLEPDQLTGVSPFCLNIYGTTGSYMKGRPLVLWTKIEGSEDQCFTVTYSKYDNKDCMYLTRVQNGITYAINRASYSVSGGHAAIMWTLADGKKDSAFAIPYPHSTRLVNLLNYDEGLGYSGIYSGATVYFGAGGSAEWFASGSPAL